MQLSNGKFPIRRLVVLGLFLPLLSACGTGPDGDGGQVIELQPNGSKIVVFDTNENIDLGIVFLIHPRNGKIKVTQKGSTAAVETNFDVGYLWVPVDEKIELTFLNAAQNTVKIRLTQEENVAPE